MTVNDLKAEFSHAYVRAVTHAAGFFVQEANRTFDGDGVDLTLLSRGAGGTVLSPRVDVQLKATAAPVVEDPIPFDLPIKNYDELRSVQLQVARILVVVFVPEDRAAWVQATEDELVLRRCGYWMSLRGLPATENKTAKRVHLSRAACFHVANVQGIMSRVAAGGMP